MAAGKKGLFLGSFVHCKSLDELETLHDAAVFVNENGAIVTIEQGMDLQQAEETVVPKLGWSKEEYVVTESKKGEFFFPGFIGKFLILSSSLKFWTLKSEN
jgi:guanine deaminase